MSDSPEQLPVYKDVFVFSQRRPVRFLVNPSEAERRAFEQYEKDRDWWRRVMAQLRSEAPGGV
mgnify:CR=1 FL=1